MPTTLNWRGENLEQSTTPIISATNRGYRLGESVFETIRVYNQKPFALQSHLQRLARGCELLKWQLPYEMPRIEQLIADTISASRESSASLRLTVTAADSPPVHPEGQPTDMSIFVTPLGAGVGASHYPETAYREGIVTKILNTPRPPASCWPTEAKFGNYLGSLWARNELKAAPSLTQPPPGDLIEGIQLTVEGEVASGTVSNIFIVDSNNQLVTPPIDVGALAGVIRKTVLSYAAELGIAAQEKRIRPDDLAAAKECFFTNSLMELLPVREILRVATFQETPGAITRQLHKRYLEEASS